MRQEPDKTAELLKLSCQNLQHYLKKYDIK